MTDDLRRRTGGDAGEEELSELSELDDEDLLVGELREELKRGAGVGVAGAGELSFESAGKEIRRLALRGVRD